MNPPKNPFAKFIGNVGSQSLIPSVTEALQQQHRMASRIAANNLNSSSRKNLFQVQAMNSAHYALGVQMISMQQSTSAMPSNFASSQVNGNPNSVGYLTPMNQSQISGSCFQEPDLDSQLSEMDRQIREQQDLIRSLEVDKDFSSSGGRRKRSRTRSRDKRSSRGSSRRHNSRSRRSRSRKSRSKSRRRSSRRSRTRSRRSRSRSTRGRRSRSKSSRRSPRMSRRSRSRSSKSRRYSPARSSRLSPVQSSQLDSRHLSPKNLYPSYLSYQKIGQDFSSLDHQIDQTLYGIEGSSSRVKRLNSPVSKRSESNLGAVKDWARHHNSPPRDFTAEDRPPFGFGISESNEDLRLQIRRGKREVSADMTVRRKDGVSVFDRLSSSPPKATNVGIDPVLVGDHRSVTVDPFTAGTGDREFQEIELMAERMLLSPEIKALLLEFGLYSCNLCGVQFSNAEGSVMHYYSGLHSEMMAVRASQNIPMMANTFSAPPAVPMMSEFTGQMDPVMTVLQGGLNALDTGYCKLCRSKMTKSIRCIVEHLNGQRHRNTFGVPYPKLTQSELQQFVASQRLK